MVFITVLFSQQSAPDIAWAKTYGGSADDIGNSVQRTSDGGFIIVGSTGTTGSNDVLLIKTDSYGIVEWETTYGGNGNDIGNSVKQANDGGFIIVGSSNSFGSGNDDIYVIKTDSQGDLEWSEIYGDGIGPDIGHSVQLTSDGGFIVVGQTKGNHIGASHEIKLLKIDSSGNQLWSNIFGGDDDDVGYSVKETSDGGFVITGNYNNNVCLINTKPLPYTL